MTNNHYLSVKPFLVTSVVQRNRFCCYMKRICTLMRNTHGMAVSDTLYLINAGYEHCKIKCGWQ